MPGTRIGVYEVTGSLGAGGMGEVYRARDTKLDRDVALKVLPEAFTSDPDRLARFEREAKVLASLNHPNIGGIHGLEESSGTRALVLELIEGPTLADRIAQGPLPVDEAVAIAQQISEALEAAHEQGVVHRDLKPANVKVTTDGVVKVLDFGLAKAMEPAAGDPAVSASPTVSLTAAATQMGMVIGTAAYMAPEQARGQVVDRRADIWAFGCVLYEMLTGRRVFDARDVSEVLASVILKEPDLRSVPADVPAPVRSLLARCLVKEPKDRLRDIGEARLALRETPEEEEPATHGVALSPESRPRSRVRQIAVVAAAILATATVTGLSVWLLVRPEPPRVARFDLTAEGEAAVAVSRTQHDLAITPDGSQVVYMGGTTIPRSAVTVRGLDDLVPRALEATQADLSVGPFVSPDGAWVGFLNTSDGRLRRVSILGGPAVTIAELPGQRLAGASWGADGTIVFGTQTTGQSSDEAGLWRVAAEGGTPESLTDVEAGVNHAWPEWLPDGRHLLFTILQGALETAEVAVLDTESGEIASLVPGGFAARYLDTGHLVYAAAGSLRAVGFDVDRLQVTTTPVPVVEDLITKPGGAAVYAVGADGSLVYASGSSRIGAQTDLVWVDRNGGEEQTGAPRTNYLAIELSPEGGRVAIEAVDQKFNIDVWVWDLGRRTFTRLTRGETRESSPIWTADGTRIVFGTDEGMASVAADGTGVVQPIAGSEGGSTPFSLTADGRLVFDFLEGAGRDVRVMPLDGDGPAETLLAGEFSERRGTLSPDGRWLAYESLESGEYQIYVRPYPDVDSGRWQVSTTGGSRPRWSPAGDELFFYAIEESSLMAVAVRGEATFEWDDPKPLFSVTQYIGNASRDYAVDLDGQRFLFKKPAMAGDGEPTRLILVQNWTEELKRLVPVP